MCHGPGGQARVPFAVLCRWNASYHSSAPSCLHQCPRHYESFLGLAHADATDAIGYWPKLDSAAAMSLLWAHLANAATTDAARSSYWAQTHLHHRHFHESALGTDTAGNPNSPPPLPPHVCYSLPMPFAMTNLFNK
eukprot:g36037.t1